MKWQGRLACRPHTTREDAPAAPAAERELPGAFGESMREAGFDVAAIAGSSR
jgi:hypothetical protein